MRDVGPPRACPPQEISGALQWIAIALFLVGVLSIVRTEHYGGQLVYKHAAGVQLDIGLGATSPDVPQRATAPEKDDSE